MTEQQKPWTLIVGLDFSECGKRALRQALSMARGQDAEVHVAHAITPTDMGSGNKLERQDAALEELPGMIWRMVFAQLEDLKMGYEDVPIWLHVRLGKPVDVVRQIAVDYDGDLLVVGTHGRTGVKKFVLGSVAEALIKEAHIPVLIAHENRLSELEKTVFPDKPRPPGQEVHRESSAPHVYRSTLISAWSAMGRPTGNF